MGVILTIVTGLVIWVVLWAVGAKGFDSFMITCVFLLIAGAARILLPFLPGSRARD